MKFLALVVALVVAVSATKIENEDHNTRPDWQAIVDAVQKAGTTWQAKAPERFANSTHATLKMMLGTVLPHEDGYSAPAAFKSEFINYEKLPENFDVREAWPECAGVSGHVRDQSSCGSCWAFGSTEAFNDRYCIKTGDAETLFSPEDTVACCTGVTCSMSMGCNGGQPSGAWNWFTKVGVVSGGDFSDLNTGKTCSPYSLTNCAHHVAPTDGEPACDDLPNYRTPSCPKACESGYAVDFKKDKHFASSSYGVRGEENMMKEMMELGTLSVSLTVYEDFETYSGGVYQHTTGKALGGHAIKMIGWGVEDGTPYWLCVNSWNEGWGLNGLVKIKRGNNECGIESGVVAGEA